MVQPCFIACCLTGFDLGVDELKHFRQLGSLTPGHPEFGMTPGVENHSRPLRAGFADAVGMALAENLLPTQYERLVNHWTYTLVGMAA